jgi:hypothetical protein
LTSFVNDQLNFNKILEKQLAQIAPTVPINNNGKIPTQPEKSCKNVNSVTMRGGKTTREPSYPNQGAGKEKG